MALFEITYLNRDTDLERVEPYEIDTMLFDDVRLDKLWSVALVHAMQSKKDPELIAKIEFIAW